MNGGLIARFRMALGAVLLGSISVAVLYLVGLIPVGFTRGVMVLDPYPTFMAGYMGHQPDAPQTYEEVTRKFSEFVVEAFPIGSDVKAAIARITGGGFRVMESKSSSVELLWTRRAGPCNEQYWIVVDTNVDGTIAQMTGRLQPICL